MKLMKQIGVLETDCRCVLLWRQVVFLRNYGVLVTGDSVEEALLMAINLTAAVNTQVSTRRKKTVRTPCPKRK